MPNPSTPELVHRWCLLGFMTSREELVCEECMDLYREAQKVLESFADAPYESLLG